LAPAHFADTYIRTNFTLEDGLPSGFINAVVQSESGFLWIGSNTGLAKFNGRRFTPIYFRGPQSTPQGVVRALALAPNGDLWVGTGAGIAHIQKKALEVFDRSLVSFFHTGIDKRDFINCLRFNRDGSLWIGTDAGLFHWEGAGFQLVLPQISVSRLEEAANGHMLITSSEGPFELDKERVVGHNEIAFRLGVQPKDVFHVFEDHGGTRWICTKEGVFQENGQAITAISPHNSSKSPAFRIVEDHRGNLWVFTTEGLSRVSGSHLELVVLKLKATCAYTDRDGILWIGRKGDGLVRFKERPVQMIDSPDLNGRRTVPMTVFSDHEGGLWIGNSCGGLAHFDGKSFRTYAEQDGLSNSCVYALAQDTYGDLWVGTWGGGLFKFSSGKFTQYAAAQGLADNVVKAIAAAKDGSIWIATDDGLSHLQNGEFRNFTTADGLSSNRVNNVFVDRRGGTWAGTSGGVNRLSGERFVSVLSTPKILDNDGTGFVEDSAGNLYALSAPKGISRIRDKLIGIEPDLDITSMVEIPGKDFWFAGSNGLFRLPVGEINREQRAGETPLDFEHFGHADGLNSVQCSSGVPNMTIGPDGKLWVATTQGLAVLDLARLQLGERQAAPYIDEITIGNTREPAERELTLPPGTHHVELHFDSIELASPEKIRFQYRLDGVDSSWLDADAAQAAVYTSVPIGEHAFHVRATNRSGVWDASGIVYRVTERPFFYETLWFQLCCLVALVLLLAAAYRFRLKQIAHEYNLRLEERVSERTRIARELHDTLLQSFHGLMLRFQAVHDMLPEWPVRAKESLEIAIDRAATAITEGRNAVEELRGSRIGSSDLVEALTGLGQELRGNPSIQDGRPPAHFDVLVEGAPRPLHPILRDSLYRIAREATGNAFCHAEASRIEVELCYENRMLRLRVRDDGIGIDPKLLERGGRDGHWGLPGMRERAKEIGGRLDVWSELGQGTEVEVTIAGTLAYQDSEDRDSSRGLATEIRNDSRS
jgi:signal transduction histidine kinase/ligand-binding sensor domain-containing protein